jgi:hypothetical protein
VLVLTDEQKPAIVAQVDPSEQPIGQYQDCQVTEQSNQLMMEWLTGICTLQFTRFTAGLASEFVTFQSRWVDMIATAR